MQIIFHHQSALKDFIGKFYMIIGLSTELLAAEFTKICCIFQCVGPKNRSGANFFSRFYASGNLNSCAERFR